MPSWYSEFSRMHTNKLVTSNDLSKQKKSKEIMVVAVTETTLMGLSHGSSCRVQVSFNLAYIFLV